MKYHVSGTLRKVLFCDVDQVVEADSEEEAMMEASGRWEEHYCEWEDGPYIFEEEDD